MALKFSAPVLEEAMALFLAGGREALPLAGPSLSAGSGSPAPQVHVLPMPERKATPEVERRVFLAVWNGLSVRVRYASVNSGTEEWRCVHPRCFIHNGSRWHVRGWCEKAVEWRDFNLARMAEAEWPTEPESVPPGDARDRAEIVRVRPHRDLSESARAAVERDFGMQGGSLDIEVSGLVADYLRSRLHLPLSDGREPGRLLEEIRD